MISYLLKHRAFPDTAARPQLIETHISWVILTDRYAFKIKKPVRFDFLDFTELDQRKYYCEEEVRLNSRFAKGIYLGVIPIHKTQSGWEIGGKGGEIVEYAVCMKRLKGQYHMSHMLRQNRVSPQHMQALALTLVEFHRYARIIPHQHTSACLKSDFGDLLSFISHFENREQQILQKAALSLDSFLAKHPSLFPWRVKQGWIRDCHGDLHAGNIFLQNPPIVFDCIEFNTDFREIDILNDLAFLCMELDFVGRDDLSHAFLQTYLSHFPVMHSPQEEELFLYYKMYRANVRAKVHLLKSLEEKGNSFAENSFQKAQQYIALMDSYLEELAQKSHICV